MISFVDRPDWHLRYINSSAELMKAALQGGETALGYDRERILFLDSHRKTRGTRRYAFDEKRVTEGLQRFRGRLSPLLKLPSILKRPTEGQAIEILSKMFQGSAHKGLVKEILARARAQEGDFRYRTETSHIMVGHNGSDIRSLAGFAHELGHCLFERLYPHVPSLEFYSELFAICLEFRVVDAYLSHPIEKREWADYQAQVDELNFALAEFERGSSSGSIGFDRPLLLLRETLFTRPGYQALYAEASVRRAKILGRSA